MIDFLLGVPGKLKAIADHLTTYWTSTRAAKLDLLTVAPAPASTALTNATWTDTRAGYVDVAVSSRASNGPRLKPPIAANFNTGQFNGVFDLSLGLDITGSGVVNYVMVSSSTSGYLVNCYVVIDGVTFPAVTVSSSSGVYLGVIGSVQHLDNVSMPIPMPIVFNSSFQIYTQGCHPYVAYALVKYCMYRTS